MNAYVQRCKGAARVDLAGRAMWFACCHSATQAELAHLLDEFSVRYPDAARWVRQQDRVRRHTHSRACLRCIAST